MLYNIYNGRRWKSMGTSSAFGEFFKAKRQALGLTLREFCLKHKLDPGNLSRLERGFLPPPQDRDRLEEYAKHLGLKSGSDDWYTFFDLAAAVKGRIPDEIMEDKEVVAKLPLVFRTLRGKRLTDKALDELVKKIKGA
jgi:transcriptional regulator with XRE-family HTH domain